MKVKELTDKLQELLLDNPKVDIDLKNTDIRFYNAEQI